MNDPAVSVIVPNYNHARYLRQRVESVLAQTYQDFELILLDDCSTDESRSILSEYARDARVRLEFNEANSGTTFRQWNKGVRLARGEYVWIAESDDYAAPQLLKRLVAILDAEREVTLAWCRSRRVLENGAEAGFADDYLPDPERWTSSFRMDGPEACRKYFALITPIPNASAMLFRKAAYEDVGGADEGLRICGDWKMEAAMALRGRIAYVEEPLNYRRVHQNSVLNRAGQAGADIAEYLQVSQWAMDRVTLSDAEVRRIWQARAKGWVPVLLSFRIPLGMKREILRAVRAYDPHPMRRVLGPAVATVRRKIQRHWRSLRPWFSRPTIW